METNETQTNNNPAETPAVHVDNTTLMGILAYLSLLVLIPLLTEKNNPEVKFHVKQGLVLLVIEAVIFVAGNILWSLFDILNILNIGALILSIVGIVNVLNKKQVELPIVGQFSKYFTI